MNRRAFFDHESATWDRHPRPDPSALQRVITLAGVRRGDRVLDVATGTGVLLPFIAEACGEEGLIAAFDFSFPMVQQAREKFAAPGRAFVQADVQALPFGAAVFDRVICNASFPHFEDRALSLREMARVLRPGGTLVISHPIGRAAVNARHRESGGPVTEDRVPAPPAMLALLRSAGFREAEVVDEPDFYAAHARKP